MCSTTTHTCDVVFALSVYLLESAEEKQLQLQVWRLEGRGYPNPQSKVNFGRHIVMGNAERCHEYKQ
jgi:hypothetical protein